MKKRLFSELVESIQQAGRIHRGEETPSRRFVFETEEARSIRNFTRQERRRISTSALTHSGEDAQVPAVETTALLSRR